jgi:hypothetical protein
MRIDVPTFLTLTVLLGTGVAVTVGVMKLREGDDDEGDATTPAAVEPAKAEPAPKPAAKAPEPAKAEPAPTITTPTPWKPSVPVDPPMPDDLEPDPDPSTIPGPTAEF